MKRVYIFIIEIFLELDYVEKGRRENYNVCNQLSIIRHDSIYLSIYISIRLQIRTYKLYQVANVNVHSLKLSV